MAVQPKSIRPPLTGSERHSGAAIGDRSRGPSARRQTAADHQRRRAPLALEPTVSPDPAGPLTSPPGAAEILFVFVAAILVMVAAVTVVAEVNRWWVLVPVMAVALVTVLGVLATITHLLADDGERPARGPSQPARPAAMGRDNASTPAAPAGP